MISSKHDYNARVLKLLERVMGIKDGKRTEKRMQV